MKQSVLKSLLQHRNWILFLNSLTGRLLLGPGETWLYPAAPGECPQEGTGSSLVECCCYVVCFLSVLKLGRKVLGGKKSLKYRQEQEKTGLFCIWFFVVSWKQLRQLAGGAPETTRSSTKDAPSVSSSEVSSSFPKSLTQCLKQVHSSSPALRYYFCRMRLSSRHISLSPN